jgi:hypothetical protein
MAARIAYPHPHPHPHPHSHITYNNRYAKVMEADLARWEQSQKQFDAHWGRLVPAPEVVHPSVTSQMAGRD